MSSCNVIGFFPLISGTRVTSKKIDTTVYHQHYHMTINCQNSFHIPALVCVYSPPGDINPSLDITIAFILAKAIFPLNKPAMLDAIQLSITPGDPKSNFYEDNIPNVPYPYIYDVGHVSGSYYSLGDARPGKTIDSCAFPVALSEYVQNNVQGFSIEYVNTILFFCIY
ncbi:hypothetical protein B0H10DRAFT_1792568 [Mycena sp. CBHHK59/15]|nr:hypothetical protein B0H10DRAFT_1792568 [Mycena sp. CBHHK59/15]